MTGQTLKKFGNRLALALAALLMVSPVTGIPASAQIQPIDPTNRRRYDYRARHGKHGCANYRSVSW